MGNKQVKKLKKKKFREVTNFKFLTQFKNSCKMISEYCEVCKIYTYFIYMDKYYDANDLKICTRCFGKDYVLDDHCCQSIDNMRDKINFETIDYDIYPIEDTDNIKPTNSGIEMINNIINGHKMYFLAFSPLHYYTGTGWIDDIPPQLCICNSDVEIGDFQTYVICDICRKNAIHHSIKLESVTSIFKIIEKYHAEEKNRIDIYVFTNDEIHIVLSSQSSFEHLGIEITIDRSKVIFKFSSPVIYNDIDIDDGDNEYIMVDYNTDNSEFHVNYVDTNTYHKDICISCFNELMNMKPELYFKLLKDKAFWKLENHRVYPQDFQTTVRNLIMCNKYRSDKLLKIPKYLIPNIIRYLAVITFIK
jgi:hypothetical protein